tara:strand:- start:937 stop:1251 length:315 start_codon:yes stop_codon:yes gene_type:complete
MAFDKTNTAISFVENGLFNREKVEALKKDGNKPVLVVKANFDGTDKEISLWFATDMDTGEYRITEQGNKFLTGKVKEPFKPVEYNKEDSSVTQKPEFDDEDLPF